MDYTNRVDGGKYKIGEAGNDLGRVQVSLVNDMGQQVSWSTGRLRTRQTLLYNVHNEAVWENVSCIREHKTYVHLFWLELFLLYLFIFDRKAAHLITFFFAIRPMQKMRLRL